MRPRAALNWVGAIAAFLAFAWLHHDPCGPFPDWQTSPYILPYPGGSRYAVLQGACTNATHRGPLRYSYDFYMPIGTGVAAVQAGTVVEIVAEYQDGQNRERQSNVVRVRHADGSVASYVHLTQHGALVKLGESVVAGQAIGISGNTGNTSGIPHLHFHVRRCPTCDTVPITFRNTEPNPDGLIVRRSYTALQNK